MIIFLPYHSYYNELDTLLLDLPSEFEKENLVILSNVIALWI